jgi:hypothetical protein
MSTSTTGYNESAAIQAITEVISGGATVHLYGGGTTASYTDTGTEVSNKSDASVAVAEADFTITTPADFSGVTTLENDNDLSYGALSIGVVDDIVIQNDANPDLFIRGDEPNNPELTGEEVTLPAGTVLYEFGNPN